MADIVFTENSHLQDSVYGKVLDPLRMVIETKAEAFEQQSLLPLLFNMEKSNKYGESITGMTSMLGPQPVGEAGDYPSDGYQEGFRSFLEHVTWKDEFQISKEMLDDNNVLQLKSRPTAFVKAWNRTREMFGIRLFGEATKEPAGSKFKVGGFEFSTATADKVNLFAKTHGSKTGRQANQSNIFADAFSADALAAAECAMQNFRDDNGVVLDVSPTTILIPNIYSLKKQVFAVLGADKDPETANNGANFLFGRWNVIISQYLNQFIDTANDTPWILIDPRYNESCIGSVWYDREPMTISAKIADNDNLIHKGRARWSAGFHDWRAFAVGGISGGTTLIS